MGPNTISNALAYAANPLLGQAVVGKQLFDKAVATNPPEYAPAPKFDEAKAIDDGNKAATKQRQVRGRASTILTSPRGLIDPPVLASRTLLGA